MIISRTVDLPIEKVEVDVKLSPPDISTSNEVSRRSNETFTDLNSRSKYAMVVFFVASGRGIVMLIGGSISSSLTP